MSHWGLTYKTFEVLWPEEWNKVVDALDELWNSLTVGLYFVVPVCKVGLGFNYNEYKSVLPYSGDIDAGYGYPLPLKSVAVGLMVKVQSNTLDGKSYVIARKNGTETDLRVEIGSGSTGIFVIDGIEVPFNQGDEIDFAVDTRNLTTGSITIGSISAVLRVVVSS